MLLYGQVQVQTQWPSDKPMGDECVIFVTHLKTKEKFNSYYNSNGRNVEVTKYCNGKSNGSQEIWKGG